MDRESVIHHLRAWADGIDPATGAALGPEHPAQRTDVLRVVFAALALLQAEPSTSLTASTSSTSLTDTSMQRSSQISGARNAGRPWLAADDDLLAAGYDSGVSVGALATRMERTRGSITARLVKLGKIEPPAGMRLRGVTTELRQGETHRDA